MYRNNSIFSKNQTSSMVNLTKWFDEDLHECRAYPDISEVEWIIADLEPGDILYTPPGWWHYVESLDPSISVLVPFDMCAGESISILQSL